MCGISLHDAIVEVVLKVNGLTLIEIIKDISDIFIGLMHIHIWSDGIVTLIKDREGSKATIYTEQSRAWWTNGRYTAAIVFIDIVLEGRTGRPVVSLS